MSNFEQRNEVTNEQTQLKHTNHLIRFRFRLLKDDIDSCHSIGSTNG